MVGLGWDQGMTETLGTLCNIHVGSNKTKLTDCVACHEAEVVNEIDGFGMCCHRRWWFVTKKVASPESSFLCPSWEDAPGKMRG